MGHGDEQQGSGMEINAVALLLDHTKAISALTEQTKALTEAVKATNSATTETNRAVGEMAKQIERLAAHQRDQHTEENCQRSANIERRLQEFIEASHENLVAQRKEQDAQWEHIRSLELTRARLYGGMAVLLFISGGSLYGIIALAQKVAQLTRLLQP